MNERPRSFILSAFFWVAFLIGCVGISLAYLNVQVAPGVCVALSAFVAFYAGRTSR